MLVVRLKRIGKKNKPAYRIVVAEHSNAVNGPFVEDLGFYNPHTKVFSIDKNAVTDWMNKGAKPSNTVARLLEKEKIKHKSIVFIKYQKAPKKKVGSPADLSSGALAKEGATSKAEGKAAPATKPETTAESAEMPTEEEAAEATEAVTETTSDLTDKVVSIGDKTPADLSSESLTQEGDVASSETTELPADSSPDSVSVASAEEEGLAKEEKPTA